MKNFYKQIEDSLKKNEEKSDRAAELLIANKELAFQNEEKEKRAAELLIANKELVFQNEEKEKRAAELLIANKELASQNEEKEKRAAELLIANEELAFQNEEKEKRAAELLIANEELVFQNEEKEKKAMQTNTLKEHNLELKLQKKMLTEASQHKSSFLSNMSHEIRTPLNAIVGFTDLSLKTSLTSQQRNYLSKIKVSSQNLLNIIGDILDISKLEAGKVELEVSPLELEEMLQDIIAQISAVSQAKGLELLISIAEDVPVYLMGDSLRLGQVLTNLVGNAVKFTDEGEVCIKVELLKNGGSSVLLQFSVKDTGIGLTEEQINNLFQPFNQAETFTTRKYGGTGLGLAISRNLVSLMGGEIWVESEMGKVSTFFVTVRFDLPEKERFSSFKNAFAMWNMKVLVVDDSLDSQEITKEMLTYMSFDVTTCGSGEEAVVLIKEAAACKGYDLVIMDWKMPGIGGIEASRRIKRLFASNDAPVIIMLSSYNSPQLRAEAKQLGLAFVLDKPVTPSLMLNTIMHVFGKEEFEQTDTRLDEVFEPEFLEQFFGTRVLLVEDNIINQEVAQEILQQAGLTVTVAVNGKEAVNMVMSNTYDIVLMDIHMPVMDGYDATRQIRNDPAFAELPIIAVTANVLQEEKEKCIQAGMNAYIAKPIDTTLLFQTMGVWIKKNHKSSQEKESLVKTEQLPSANKSSAIDDDVMPELKGIDIQSALSRLGGNQKLYRKLLVNFYNNHQNDIRDIRRVIELGNLKTAERIVHTIKGAAGNIGAQEVFTAASAVEAEFKEYSLGKAEPLIVQLERALEQVFSSITVLHENGDETATSEHDAVSSIQLMPVLKELAKLLSDNDLDASEFLEGIVSRSPKSSILDKMAQIKGLVDQYDFDGALIILNETLRVMKESVENEREHKQL